MVMLVSGPRRRPTGLRVARRLGGRGVVASYRRLGIGRLLPGVGTPEPLDAFVEDWIGPLLRSSTGSGAWRP
jgi:hypothetical protein